MLASIIISVRNDSRITHCLESIFTQGAIGLEGKFEVVVCENAATPVLSQVIQQFPVVYCVEPRPGMGYARETALLKAVGDYIVFTDADCVVSRGWLASLLDVFINDEIGIVGGPIIKYNPQTEVERMQRDLVIGQQRELQFLNPIYTLPYVVTANAAYRGSALRAAGGIDPDFFSCGDVDLAWKIGDLGYKACIAPNAMVYHACRPTRKSVFKQFYTYSLGHALLFKKYKERADKKVCWNWFPFVGLLRLVQQSWSLLMNRQSWAKKRDHAGELSFRAIEYMALIAGAAVGSYRFKVAYI